MQNAIFTIKCKADSFREPLSSAVKQVHQIAADVHADGDTSRVEIYIEGKPLGKVEIRVDGELIENSSLLPPFGFPTLTERQ